MLVGVLVSSSLTLFAQNESSKIHVQSANQLSPKAVHVDKPIFVSPDGVTDEVGGKQAKYRSEVYDFVEVGNTYYDLQSNASVGRRAILHDDGTVSVSWTYSGTSSTTWPDRGSVVNYHDGTNWGSAPTSRVESNLRTGWPSIGMFGDGSMYIVSHDPAAGGFLITRNSGKGKSDWVSDNSKVMEHPSGELIWNRTANIGDKMFSLSCFYPENTGDVTVNGIVNPIMFSQSDDRGKTWSPLTFLPGYDSTRHFDGDGDVYAIDTRDSVVAIVLGGSFRDVTLIKSTDSGSTWTTSIIDSFQYPRFQWGRHLTAPETYTSNDGALDVLIDNNGDVHVVTGRLSYSDDDTTDDLASSGSFYDLYHWSENWPSWKVCGSPIDMDGQPSTSGAPYDITGETTNSMGADGNPQNGLAYAARYGGTSISTHPSLSVDKNNVIYVTWDAPVEFTFNDYLANYRDVHISYSKDNGASWATSQNATQVRSQEAVYACLTKRTDDFVHFIFQMDEHPGTNVINSGSGNLHPNVENKILYAAIPVQDLMDSVLGQNTLSTKPVIRESKVFVVSQNQPNPFSDATEVVIYLRAESDLTCTITDAMGKVVSIQNMGFKGAGNHKLTIDGQALTSGVYFYTLSTNDSEVTKKMQVLK